MAADARKTVERALARAVREHALWSPGARLVVAVSGGADSLCLLGVLLALREREHRLAPGELIVAHLDHGLRGEESREDARFVERLAAELGLRCIVETARPSPPPPSPKEGGAATATDEPDDEPVNRSEYWARSVRYAFLRRTAAEEHAERIVTGHTRDDQAETIVLHWLRGSGLAGLQGMAPLRGDIARPLLAVSRAQTVAYCAAMGWEPHEDSSNADTRYLRNRVRHELLPLLATYNPGIRDLLIENGQLLAADDAYLVAQAQAAWTTLATTTAHDIRLPLEALRDLHPAIRHRLYRAAAHHLAGEATLLTARQILAIDQQIAAGHTGTALDLTAGIVARLAYDGLHFQRQEQVRADVPKNQEQQWDLPVPGEVEMPELGWRLRAWRIEGTPGSEDVSELPPAPELPPLSFGDRPAEIGRAESRVYLDATSIGPSLSVRTWQPGDRFQPLGMRGEKKLQDYFGDARVPRDVRTRVPLVYSGDQLLWVAGLRISHHARLTPATAAVVVLQLEPLTEFPPDPAPAESSR